MLAGDELRRRRVVEVADAAAESVHIQPNGIDLSLDAVWRFLGEGSLGRSPEDRTLPERQELAASSDGWLELRSGTYGVRYLERVSVPIDCGGLCFPRSSLLRMGVSVPTAVWDAGYSGRGEGLLVVSNPHGVRLQRGARIVQFVLFSLTETATTPYAGRYQNEGTL